MPIKNKIPTNKNFGLVFCFVFFLIFLEPIIRNEELRYWSIIISLIFLILGLTNSKLLKPLNKIWYKFGLFLGKTVSPIIMGIIFFLVITPTSFNVRGEPIVSSPVDAFHCFMGTELDKLVIGNCYLNKKEQKKELITDYRKILS